MVLTSFLLSLINPRDENQKSITLFQRISINCVSYFSKQEEERIKDERMGFRPWVRGRGVVDRAAALRIIGRRQSRAISEFLSLF